MDSLLIISLALLAGIATAGAVWYVWGLVENVVVVRKQMKAEAERKRLEDETSDDEAEADEDETEADSA